MSEYDEITAGLPRHWRVAPLGELVEDKGISYGIVQPGNHSAQGVPVVRVKDLKNGKIDTTDPMRVAPGIEATYARTRLSGGEVLLSLVGSVGESAVAPKSLAGWNVARAIAVLRTNRTVSAQWLNICLSVEPVQHYIRMSLNTTVQATLNLKDVRRLPIIIPPMEEMAAISAVLSALDDKIAVNDRIAETSHELAAADHARVTQQSERTCALDDVIEFAYGKALPAAKRRPGPVAVYGSGGISGSHDEPLVRGPGIIIGRKGTVGSIYWSHRDFFPIDTTYYVKLVDERLTIEYVYFLLTRLGLHEMNSDSAVPGLNRSRALSILVNLPKEEVIAKFTERVRALFAMREERIRENEALTQLRDTLLPELMSGRLRVKEAEKVVEDAV